MRGQITFLTETSSTVVTSKWFLVVMSAHVDLEVLLPIEHLGTFGAGIGFYAGVDRAVLIEIGLPSKILSTLLTRERSLVFVDTHVVSDTVLRGKIFVTLRTIVGFFTSVCPPMCIKMTFLAKTLSALVTNKRFLARVGPYVIVECTQSSEAQRALGAVMYFVHFSLCRMLTNKPSAFCFNTVFNNGQQLHLRSFWRAREAVDFRPASKFDS